MILSVHHAQLEARPLPWKGLPGLRWYDVRNRVGESPCWDARRQSLYWVDVRAPAVFRLEPATGTLVRWDLPEPVGALGLAGDDRLVLALRHQLAVLDVQRAVLSPWVDVESHGSGNRLNDGKVSPSGRWFVFGSMDDRPTDKQPTGGLYCAGTDGSLRRLHAGLTVANGIAWSLDGETLYFSDSARGSIWRAAWNEIAGTMASPELHCQLTERTGRPDGAAVDRSGDYWSAGVSAGRLNRIDPRGAVIDILELPCRAPTMASFGGSDGRTVYVTSLVRQTGATPQPWDGGVFAFQAPCGGEPAPVFRL